MKKINLLPNELKTAELMRTVRKFALILAMVPIIYLVYIGVMNVRTVNQIEEIKTKISTVESLERSLKGVREQISDKQEFLEMIDVQDFPYTSFVKFIQNMTPDDLTIISIDTTDRLIRSSSEILPEGEDTGSDGANVSDALSNSIEDDEDMENRIEGKGNDDTSDTPVETPVETTKSNELHVKTYPKLEAKNSRIVVRGFSDNNVSIADFVYNISLQEYINDVSLTAIEERLIDKNVVNVFELILDTGK